MPEQKGVSIAAPHLADWLDMSNEVGGPPRRSVGIVEHVRVVHMLLVVTSVSLILITLSAKSYNPAKALTELQQIQRLQKDWTPEYLYALTEADINNLPIEAIGEIEQNDTGTFAVVPPSPPHSFPCWIGGQKYNCKPHENWRSKLPESWSAVSFPRTVSEFSRFWDSLDKEANWVDFVNQIGPGTTLSNPKKKITVVDFGTSAATNAISHNQPQLPIQDISLWLVSGNEVKDANGNAKKDRNGNTILVYMYWDKPAGANERHEWEIPVLTRKRIKLDRDALTKIFPKWSKGSFALSFADLAQASRGLEELEFADLREKLKAEAASGTGFFEVAGLKIPSGQVTTVGIIAVLCIQLYLLILLRELSHRLSSDDASWDVPWIGMFGSRLAHWATWISIVAFPVAAVGLLAWHGFSTATPARVLFVMPLLLACLVASATWSYRPRVASAPGPAASQS